MSPLIEEVVDAARELYDAVREMFDISEVVPSYSGIGFDSEATIAGRRFEAAMLRMRQALVDYDAGLS